MLAPGSRIGGYEIRSSLGRGGMGEVWLAHDPRLRRDVAIKTLPPGLTTDPEQRQRFEREARLLAALNHPNVAAIYGVAEEKGERFLVLELVEGMTLAERLAKGPLPMAEALAVCIQIAAGLEAAHTAGIIHRDLKPSNIKLRSDGGVKVLDLGLARVVEKRSVEAETAPTLTARPTRSGTVLGTAGYMSPEQARGLDLDRRSDIFSFGAVLYECVTGKVAFVRATPSDALAAVLTSDPDWGALPLTLPKRVADLLRRCLRKDPRHRLHDIADARIELEDAQGETAGESGHRWGQAEARTWRGSIPWALGGLLAVALAFILGIELRRPVPRSPTMRATLHLPAGLVPSLPSYNSVVFSPDGRTLVFAGSTPEGMQLYRRPLDGTTVEPLAGTEGGFAPFFSPDGEWLAFFTSTHLLKLPIRGGTPLKLCEVPPVTCGGAWRPGGSIIFARTFNGALWVVPEGGGEVQPLTRLGEGEQAHLYPQVLPNDWLLFTAVVGQDFQDMASSRIVAFNPRSGEKRLILEGSGFARYVGTGWIVFVRGDEIFAARFDTQTMRVTDSPVVVPESIAVSLGMPHLDVSRDGTLGYVSGPPRGEPTTVVLSLDRRGHETHLPVPRGYYMHPSLSPDGRRLALTRCEKQSCKGFVFERDRQVLAAMTPEPGRYFGQIWSPDGRRLACTAILHGAPRLAFKAADGSGTIEPLSPATEDAEFPNSWSPDGRTIAYCLLYEADRGGSRRRHTADIWLASLGGSSSPQPWMETPYSEIAACFSPDGRSLAYVSDESGENEVCVRPVAGGGKVQISSGGGIEPVWVRGGRELLYRQGNRFLAVDLGAAPHLVPGRPRLLFERPLDSAGGRVDVPRQWDASRDGEEIIVLLTTLPAEPVRQLMVVTGWLSELELLRQHAESARTRP